MFKVHVHGNQKGRSDLYRCIGDWIVSSDVQEELGISVTAEPGDIWYFNSKGFVQVRLMENMSAHIRYAYATNKKHRTSLVQKCLKDLKLSNVPLIFTNERSDDVMWKQLGFQKKSRRPRSKFIRWEKTLNE